LNGSPSALQKSASGCADSALFARLLRRCVVARLGLFFGLLLRAMMADCAAGSSARDPMLPGHMARHAAHSGAFDATFSLSDA
jgi:hypothetical protein